MIKKFKFKHIIGMLAAFLFIFIGIQVYFLFFKTLHIQVKGNLMNENVELQANNVKLEKIKSGTKTLIKSKDYFTTYKLSSPQFSREYGKFTVTVRKLDNNDVFVFTKFQNQTKQPIIIDLSLSFGQDFTSYKVTRFHSEKIKHEHDPTLGVDPTSTPHGLIELKGKRAYANMMLSKNYNSMELIKKYNQTQQSKLRELIKETDGTEITKKGHHILINMPHFAEGQSLSESWILYSNQPLFNKKENFKEWEKHTLKEYKKINKWYTAEGPFGKLPWSIEPSTKLGYGRYFALVHDRRYVDHYENTKERYFYDFIVNSVANLLTYDSQLNKPIPTEITSTWLKDNYGIIAPYYDTRFNEYIAIHLKRISKLLDVPEYRNMSLFYADYLLKQVKKENYIKTDNGYIICDFYGKTQKKKTHASLNHSLGEMNFLLESYLETGKKEYLAVALNIKKGIEDVGDKWIKDNKDLWYQLNPNFTFHGKDYPLLTLEDLLKAQNNLKKAGINRSKIFDQLIKSKTQYLVNHKIEMTKKVIASLQQEGFGDLVKNYTNISDY
ncbi:hypothetical protein [Thermaerobacillus caldiproteolyticus]|uniref:hypothetical protein n=1 Tax=Thermaerobacillus caldiproteolyticus TaxID=247480 RepID=UPI00188A0345|nr:hypothetical protein [Anoxybacillus caldiproteolyticus]QPA32249.1 hypothetical protein ISX45_04510 [Anoxybacillus caldiproteolyticus]